MDIFRTALRNVVYTVKSWYTFYIKIIKTRGVTQCGFFEQPKVVNAASQLLIDVFGDEKGKAARSAIGTNNLPGNITVEIEFIFEVNS